MRMSKVRSENVVLICWFFGCLVVWLFGLVCFGMK